MSSEDLRRELVDLIREHDLASDENTSPRDYRAALADAILPLVEEAVNAERERALVEGFSAGVNFIDNDPSPSWGGSIVAGRAEAARRRATIRTRGESHD